MIDWVVALALAFLGGVFVWKGGKNAGRRESSLGHIEDVEELNEEIAQAHLDERRARSIVERVRAAVAGAIGRGSGGGKK